MANAYMINPYILCDTVEKYELSLREVLEQLRAITVAGDDEDRKYRRDSTFMKLFQDNVLHVLDLTLRSIRLVDITQTISQVLDSPEGMQHKLMYCSRFLKEYPHGLHQKWRLRAEKLAYGLVTGEEAKVGTLSRPQHHGGCYQLPVR